MLKDFSALPTPPALSGLLQALGSTAMDLDELLARTGSSTEGLLAQLLELELEGWVERQPGGTYQRRWRG